MKKPGAMAVLSMLIPDALWLGQGSAYVSLKVLSAGLC